MWKPDNHARSLCGRQMSRSMNQTHRIPLKEMSEPEVKTPEASPASQTPVAAQQPLPPPQQSQFKNQIVCTTAARKMLDQIETTYTPSHSKAVDVFVTLCNQEEAESERARKFADPLNIEINSVFQTLACWGLARLRNTENGFALRESALFLTSLEQAASHLQKAFAIDSTLKTAVSKRF